MKLTIDAAEVWEDLADCEVGDEKVLTFTVTKKSAETIAGTATAVEYAGEDYEEEMPAPHAGKRGGPPALALIFK